MKTCQEGPLWVDWGQIYNRSPAAFAGTGCHSGGATSLREGASQVGSSLQDSSQDPNCTHVLICISADQSEPTKPANQDRAIWTHLNSVPHLHEKGPIRAQGRDLSL